MSSARPAAAKWVAGIALLNLSAAQAAPRDPPARVETGLVATVEPAVLLQRLVGRFDFDGAIVHQEMADFDRNRDVLDGELRGATQYFPDWSQPVQGKGDCIAFSDGPGLQCVVNIAWPEQWRDNGKIPLGGVSGMMPAMILSGLTPASAPGQIRFLLVDKPGLSHPGALTLEGNAAVARPACVNMPGMQRCDQIFRLTARSEAGIVHVQWNVTTRFLRQKTDRKRSLGTVGNPPRSESSTEWAEEILDVSFALKRQPQPVTSAPADATPAQGSR